MRSPKKVKRVVKYLNEIETVLSYYLPPTPESKVYRLYLKELRELIEDLSLDKKVNDAKIAKKIIQDIENNKKS